MALDSNTTLASRPVKEVYAVSRLVREARGVLEGSFPLIWVEGEISNLAMPASGHIYFTLKDEVAQVRCAMFRNRNRNVRFTPKNGMQVLLRVRVTLYEGRGEFQLVVEHMEEAGSGALQRAYEALKHRLGEEGLFSQEHKKELPNLPQRIGIISSPDGAAVHDILTVLNRRFPAANVVLYPVAVQGSDSAQQIINAIKVAEQRQECDVLILSRGGGSLEDLWSFNDEQLARKLFSCQLPVISAVGHEVDFTIVDFIADVRAPTPSAAAEIVVPDAVELLRNVEAHYQRLTLLMKHQLQYFQTQLNHLQQRLPDPQVTINQHKKRLEHLSSQLQRGWAQLINERRQHLDYWAVRLIHPQSKIEVQQQRVAHLKDRLHQVMDKKLVNMHYRQHTLIQQFQALSPLPEVNSQKKAVSQIRKRMDSAIQQQVQRNKLSLAHTMRTLSAVSPLNTLERGYSITSLADSGKVVRRASDVTQGEHLNIRLQQGQIHCEVIDTE